MNSLSAHPDARPPEAPDLARCQRELVSQRRFRTEQLSWLAAGNRLGSPAAAPDALVSAVSEVSEALADGARAQATALYQLLYQAGSAALGWLVGVVFDLAGWPGVVGAMVLCAGAGAVALRRLGRV